MRPAQFALFRYIAGIVVCLTLAGAPLPALGQSSPAVGPNPDSLPGYYGLATGSWKHWASVWGVDYEWIKQQFVDQTMMEKPGITVSRWIDAVLEKNEYLDQGPNVKAVAFTATIIMTRHGSSSDEYEYDPEPNCRLDDWRCSCKTRA